MDPQRRTLLRACAPVGVLAGIYAAAGALLRVVLWWQFGRVAEVPAVSLVWILSAGLVNDLVVAAYLLLPLTLYLSLFPGRWHRRSGARALLALGSVATLAGLGFLAVAEYFFFEEFDARLNLVAVDYLVYPTEVIGDIRAEYPVMPVLGAALLAGIGLCWLLRRHLFPADADCGTASPWQRAAPLLAQCAVVTGSIVLVSTDTFGGSANRVANELAANGVSSFFRAVRTSEMDYPAHYRTQDAQANFARLADYLAAGGGTLTGREQGRLTRHFAADPRGLGRLNVIVVVEEALGAEFSRLYGSAADLTPNLDAYALRGVWFRHAYASGTRTVRGLEAIVASFPPIPSVSILRRPNNEHIATWGGVMRRSGYQASFLYGGYGYFDNMNYFFGHNGFDVFDRTDIDQVRFANIWGVSDEDLFERALAYYDERARSGQPFLSLIMTTSNHKPFTFRAGVPGVPVGGGGRAAGVRYADFALGWFLREAGHHSWFDHTLFVIVADHGARVYGKADIPLRTYEIPLLFYAPGRLAPRRIDLPIGQIDVAPTVLGLLGLEYEAPFFGSDVLACERRAQTGGRVLLFNHNYDVAALRDGRLVVLGLGQRARTLAYARDDDRYTSLPADQELTDLTVAIYQTAYEQFRQHHYK